MLYIGYVNQENYVDNPQTRMLAGAEFMHGECIEEVLELAKSNKDFF